MNVSLAEAQEAPRQTLATTDGGLRLMERAEGLGRAAVMEEVLGPHLDAMLRPIYERGIAPDEKRLPSLADEFPMNVLARFFERLRTILEDRFNASVSESQEYEEFLELSEQRPDLLFYADNPMQNIKEALGTSIGVPLTVSTWISGLEKTKGLASPYRDVDGLAGIMERESFHRILLRLTKGPNEFLGSGSDNFREPDRVRFYGMELSVRDAFEVEDGKVVDLSGAYAVAAEQRRTKLRKRHYDRHRGNDSSGCPVRHGFEDADGKDQSPLVLTGNEFAVAAMRYAEQLPLDFDCIGLRY